MVLEFGFAEMSREVRCGWIRGITWTGAIVPLQDCPVRGQGSHLRKASRSAVSIPYAFILTSGVRISTYIAGQCDASGRGKWAWRTSAPGVSMLSADPILSAQ